MTYWTLSSGIVKRKTMLEACLGETVKQYSAFSRVKAGDVFIGWGLKANTLKVKRLAKQHDCRYLHLEDGFLGYIGHPANKGHALSIVSDDLGIYYDARQESQLERLIKQELDDSERERASAWLNTLRQGALTKYNTYSHVSISNALQQSLKHETRKKILIVDQVSGDLSIEGAMACVDDFHHMVACARKDNPEARLFLRRHPDTRFSKLGVLAQSEWDDVEYIDEACHPHGLIDLMDEVYTVSSQMGLEALILGKPVVCFGVPFYAGWGLTQDHKSCERREPVSLEQLVFACYHRYATYFDPILKVQCQPESLVDLIEAQYSSAALYNTMYCVGFSWWKRSFLRAFCAKMARKISFVPTPPDAVGATDRLLLWGRKCESIEDAIRVEDGFIRSNGLGSNLRRPSSLSFDTKGIYFDTSRESELSQALKHIELSAVQRRESRELLALIRQTGVSKYNLVGTSCSFHNTIPNNRKVILVVGQVEGDASLALGSPDIQTNTELLYRVKANEPDAYIIYKPHPDVSSGNRPGNISRECELACVDEISLQPLINLFPHIDVLHTMTSTSGFEALIHKVSVVTWGKPFYAGWGLTQDKLIPVPYRELELESLIYACLVGYCTYFDWDTRLYSTAKRNVLRLSSETNEKAEPLTLFGSLRVKCGYLYESLRQK